MIHKNKTTKLVFKTDILATNAFKGFAMMNICAQRNTLIIDFLQCTQPLVFSLHYLFLAKESSSKKIICFAPCHS